MKSWNIRDQTKEALETLLRKKYNEIEGNYKMLKKISDINDAKKIIDEIWQMKSFANAIELELIRREYTNGTTSWEDEGRKRSPHVQRNNTKKAIEERNKALNKEMSDGAQLARERKAWEQGNIIIRICMHSIEMLM